MRGCVQLVGGAANWNEGESLSFHKRKSSLFSKGGGKPRPGKGLGGGRRSRKFSNWGGPLCSSKRSHPNREGKGRLSIKLPRLRVPLLVPFGLQFLVTLIHRGMGEGVNNLNLKMRKALFILILGRGERLFPETFYRTSKR